MLFLLAAWTGLIVVSFVIGAAILGAVRSGGFKQIGDRFIASVWLGIVLLCISLLTVSFFLPLSPTVGAAVAGLLVAIALSFPHTRAEITALYLAISPAWLFAGFVVAIGIAISTAYPVIWYDTGLYHFQFVNWLSKFGTVPGLALLHFRLGFTSSWFAFAAPFNAGAVEARTSSLPGGFVLLLAAIQLLINFSRIARRRGEVKDWLVVLSLSLIHI